MQLVRTVRSLVCQWKSFFAESQIAFWSHQCNYTDNTLQNPLHTEVTGTQESYRYLQAQFERHSQRALGKYSSLQLTRKTIAQTTALRQKDVNYFHGCCVIFVAFLPTTALSTFDKADKFHKAFDSFFSFFPFFLPKANDEQPFPPFERTITKTVLQFPWGSQRWCNTGI